MRNSKLFTYISQQYFGTNISSCWLAGWHPRPLPASLEDPLLRVFLWCSWDQPSWFVAPWQDLHTEEKQSQRSVHRSFVWTWVQFCKFSYMFVDVIKERKGGQTNNLINYSYTNYLVKKKFTLNFFFISFSALGSMLKKQQQWKLYFFNTFNDNTENGMKLLLKTNLYLPLSLHLI